MNNLKSNIFAQLAKLSESFEIDLDKNGYLRTISNKENNYPLLDGKQYKASPISKQKAITLVRQFLGSAIIEEVLETKNFNMKLSEIASFAFGYRLTFKQNVNYKKSLMPVRGGAVHIAINAQGEIFSMSSTLQHGKVLPFVQKTISKKKAIILALAKCKQVVTSAHAKLIFAAHKGQIQPLYEVKLGGKLPYKSHMYLILANTGEVIYEFSKKIRFLVNYTNDGIKADALLLTPDPDLPITDQISTTSINCLPHELVLKNAYFEMFTGGMAKIVYAKDDITYCYSPDDSEFAAVSVFISLQKQIELYLSLGLRLPEQPMFVVVNDSFLSDNAYFDPQRYEIHIGVGSGVEHGGLTEHIAFDLSVANHEFGHAAVSLQAAGGDFIGGLGEAINEAIGDVLGALVMDYLGRIWHAKEFGGSFTAHDLKNDARIIGKYALPPFGIRCQKNSKKLPGDLVGECHADGLIIGGALADLLADMAEEGAVLEEQIKLFVKLTLMALALLPSYQVTFNDMLRALITADKEICFGKYRWLIEKCFASHGIVLDTRLSFKQNSLPIQLAVIG